jgi:hypothetical protein
MAEAGHDNIDELPTRVELVVGGRLDFRLPPRGVTGHEWTVHWEGNVVARSQIARMGPEADGLTAAGRETAMLLSLTGTAPGTSTLRITRRRAWQPAEATDETKVLVTVRDPQADQGSQQRDAPS